ncbi:exopolysaccharide biosynthesis polyprenyl glycosylphosphotransferase [Methylocystis sp. Sn-Cys]|uniref:exopolysaccharide biosynthesis polyprenyl glycosylphosphotransferase n=1 Tax=Methylocystis sp. Sn-Cys TaxID=1701263 RepID=UPI0019230417|nr:exopolysaccharide biosynthesis polyprenyl glycosylphosphotransferase [Methylocystis sp. Sn-Cys]MBL1256086.1 exopolysaccharide biosynthesis polyprenyl glycosylphosphotransferase [Methylocystis sp. Sn-Cys]
MLWQRLSPHVVRSASSWWEGAGSTFSSDRSRWRISYPFVLAGVALSEAAAIFGGALAVEYIGQSFLSLTPFLDRTIALSEVGFVVYALLCQSKGLYRMSALLDARQHRNHVILSWLLALAMQLALIYPLRLADSFYVGLLFASGAVDLALLLAIRRAFARALRAFTAKHSVAGRRAVVIGDAEELGRLSAAHLNLSFGLSEVARITLDDEAAANGQLTERGQSKLEEARRISAETNADEFVIAFRWRDVDLIAEIDLRLRCSALPVRLIPDRSLRRLVSSATSIEMPRIAMSATERAIKRGCDIALASLALLLLSPVMLATAIAIKAGSPGPVIFRQMRSGFNERKFVIYKFRTMNVLENGASIEQARKNDARVNCVGRVLRKTSIDELPQLFNVLKGDMSLVGPRPHALAHDAQYKALIQDYVYRLHVLPGMTGLAQVNGFRGETAMLSDMRRRVDFDVLYVKNWSLWLDMWILMRTPVALILGRAY